MRRTNSLPQVHTDPDRYGIRKRVSHGAGKVYRGRRSFNPTTTPRTVPLKPRFYGGRKSQTKTHDPQYDSEDVDDCDYLGVPQRRAPLDCRPLYHCIPVMRKESDSGASSLHRSISSHSQSSETDRERERDSRDHEPRRWLHHYLSTILYRDRIYKSSNVVVNKKNVDNRRVVMLTMGNKREEHKYTDVLWIILKAYFAGRDVMGSLDLSAASEHDTRICRLRETQKSVLKDLMDLKLDEIRVSDPSVLSKEYSTQLSAALHRVESLLSHLDEFEALFPNSRVMSEYCKSAAFDIDRINARVCVLNAWLTTLNDLQDKITTLGTLLEVSAADDGSGGYFWPRALHAPQSDEGLRDVRTVLHRYVKQHLTVKGMRKVLARVAQICDRSLLKATVLLQRAPVTYAQAAGAGTSATAKWIEEEFRKSKELDVLSELIRSGLDGDTARAMRLPSLLPMFLFVLQVRVELVNEWLVIRSNSCLEGGEMDAQTLETLVEDSRDCLEEAVGVKHYFVRLLEGTCDCADRLCPTEYEKNLNTVFLNYVWYVRFWVEEAVEECRTLGGKGESHEQMARILRKMTSEWGAARELSRSVSAGRAELCIAFCSIARSLVDDLVNGYLEEGLERARESAAIMDIDGVSRGGGGGGEEGEESESEELDAAAAGDHVRRSERSPLLALSRQYNHVITQCKERAARIFGLIRAAVSDLHDAAAYECDVGESEMLGLLREGHVMVRFYDDDDADLSCHILIDSATASRVGIEKFIREWMENGDVSAFSSHAHAVLVPKGVESMWAEPREDEEPEWEETDDWRGKTAVMRLPPQLHTTMKYLRSDCLLVVGGFDPRPLALSRIRLSSPACSSHESLNDHLTELSAHLLDAASRVSELTCEIMEGCMEEDWEEEERCGGGLGGGGRKTSAAQVEKEQQLMANCTLHAYNLTFQVFRDVWRVLAGAECVEMAQKSVCVVDEWMRLAGGLRRARTVHLPLWAQHAFHFIHFLSSKQVAPYLDDHHFNMLRQAAESFMSTIIGGSGPGEVARTPSQVFSSPRDSHTTTRSPVDDRRTRQTRLGDAAREADRRAEARIRAAVPLGHEVAVRGHKTDEGHRYASMLAHERRAPFQWRAMEYIGSGKFGSVHKAMNLEEKKLMAVKEMKDIGVESRVLSVLEVEVDILRTLQHPNVVQYYGFEVHETRVLLLMEYCSEGTLLGVCREGGMDIKLVRKYTHSLLDAVQYIHRMQVIHRDIKPENIFLDRSCVLKLGDFGCSKRLTGTATIMGEIAETVGTPQYMAPEVLSFGGQDENGGYKGYGRAVDVWSVGCVVLQMITGRLPWGDMNQYQITMKVCTGSRPEYPAECANIVKEFLNACFNYDPASRMTADRLLITPFANVHSHLMDLDQLTIDDRFEPVSPY